MDNSMYYDAEYIRRRIDTLKEQRGVSAREMSLSLGKNETYITGIINGKSLPNFEGFLDICDYLRITPSQFFDNDQEYPATYRELISEMERLLDRDITKIELVLSVMKLLTPSDIATMGKVVHHYHKVQLQSQ